MGSREGYPYSRFLVSRILDRRWRSPCRIFVVSFPIPGIVSDIGSDVVQITFISDDPFKVVPLPDFPDHIQTVLLYVNKNIVDRHRFERPNHRTKCRGRPRAYPLFGITLLRLILFIDDHNAMQMIRHNHIFIQRHHRKTFGQRSPIAIHNFTDWRECE
jgi:hypothetical protein